MSPEAIVPPRDETRANLLLKFPNSCRGIVEDTDADGEKITTPTSTGVCYRAAMLATRLSLRVERGEITLDDAHAQVGATIQQEACEGQKRLPDDVNDYTMLECGVSARGHASD